MSQWKSSLGVLSAFFLLNVLSGCALDQLHGSRARSDTDIQERLSSAISHNGFSHTLRSERRDDRHVDSIYISVPLDSLKRRHYSLENLIRDVAKVCSLPEYATYSIRIEFGAGDEQDRLYLKETLLKDIGEKANIRVSVEPDEYNDILISLTHPDKKVH